MTWRRWVSFSFFAAAASLAARPAAAQLAPTGGHYAGKPSDTGYAGEVNSSGGYAVSVPLDLPGARGGLPIPLQIVYGEHGVGAAGQGFDVPLSFIRRDTTFARRRPVGTAGVDPQAREQVSLVLEGRRMILVRTATGWVAQRDAPDLAIREPGDGTWVVFDGQGWTYLFTAADPALAAAGLWHLASVTGPGGNKVALGYTIDHPAVSGAASAVSIDLASIQYNPDSTGCYKNAVTLGYGAATSPMSISPVGGAILARVHVLDTVTVSSRPTCADSAETLRTYQLQYQPDVDTQRLRLSQVQMTGRQGRPEASTPVPIASYSYGSATMGGQLTYQSAPDISLPNAFPLGHTESHEVFTAIRSATIRDLRDINGDGRPDQPQIFLDGHTTLNTSAGPGGGILFGADGSNTIFNGPLEERFSSQARYDIEPEQDRGSQRDEVREQTIDFDGDGRLDQVIIDHGSWIVFLNRPDPNNPQHVIWQERKVSTVGLAQALRARGLWENDDNIALPLARRFTARENSYSACIQWLGQPQGWQEFTDAINCQAGGFRFGPLGREVTITLWELRDVNGDGYPDVVFNSSPFAMVSHFNTDFPEPPTGIGTIIRSNRTVSVQLAAGDANEVDAMLNVAGVHLSASAGDAFSAPVVLRSNAGCGVDRWVQMDSTHQRLACSITDVNDDGVADYVNDTSVFLGTGSRGPGAFFTPGAMMTLPGPLAIQSNTQRVSCGDSPPAGTRFPVSQTAVLRDLTGDGIPDYVTSDASGIYSVSIGTSTGFVDPMRVANGLSLSVETEDCSGGDPRTERGLYDLDGDGKADVVWSTAANPNVISWARLVGSSGVPGAPDAGRLVQIDNGYGAQTHITYQSAKEDPTVRHQVPFPEIVVHSVSATGTQGLGGDLIGTDYMYGGAELVFDPVLDAFTFAGYRRRVELHSLSRSGLQPVDGIAIITDTYGPATSIDPYGLVLSDGSCCAASTMDQRYKLYMRAGRTSDVTILSGTFSLGGTTLLSTDLSQDARRIAARHYDWGTRLLSASTDPPGAETCYEMVLPYDFAASNAYAASSGSYDLCTAHGFAFTESVQTWRGDPGAAPPSTANVATRSDVRKVDDFGRVLLVFHLNDVNRNDDDICVDTTYSAPVGANERVLSAVSSRAVTNCKAVTYARDSWEYDKLPVGSVSSGFATSHTVERHDELGVLLGTIREFDATFDNLGNPLIITSSREGGATRTVAVDYDPFKLVPTTITVAATGIPATQVGITRDAVTLNVLSTTDPNGSQHGTTYDGFDRPVLSLITPPGGTPGALSVTSYFGFTGVAPRVRSIVQKVFTDPVDPDPDTVAAATGRTGAVYLDELGRAMRTELTLGASYGTQKLIVGRRTYDRLGRVVFEADPFPSTQDPATAYGTTQLFNIDGTPSCAIRGNGQQPELPPGTMPATDELNAVLPTCFHRGFQDNTEVESVQDAASLLSGSPQAGVIKSSSSTAIGRILSRTTFQGDTRLEHATFTHDFLGHVTGMIRYRAPAGAKPVVASWHVDSLGQTLELDEPDSVPQLNTYSSWGELVEVRRNLTTDGTLTPSLIVKTYDALGRVIHSEQQNNGTVDPATVNDYLYDQPVNVAPQVTPTYLLGRLAQASSPTGTVSFSYDAFGGINARVFTDNHGGMYVEKHTVHADGTPAALDLFLPDTGFADEHVDYQYDSAGRGTSVHYTNGASSEDLFEATTIDPFGRVRQAQYGVTSYAASYADVGRRLMRDVSVSSPQGSRSIAYQGFDPVGRERSRTEVKNAGASEAVTSFSYDALGRLSTAVQTRGATTVLNQQYTYDPLGNLLGLINASGSSADDTRLTLLLTDRDRICRINYGTDSGSDCNVTYDQVGNVVQQATRTGTRLLSYFADGSVRNVTDGTTEAQFRYDAFGEVQELDVTSNTSADTRHDRRYGGLIAWRDERSGASTTSVLSRTIPGPDGFQATRHGAAGPWVFAFGEARGNRFFTDDTGAFVQDVDYKPYGEATSTGAQPGSPLYSNEQWNGGDALAALGIDHLGARLYDPVIGRFLSRDPLLIPRTAATTHPYAFAMNDPVNGSDPSGLDPPFENKKWNPWPFEIPGILGAIGDAVEDYLGGISSGDGRPTVDPNASAAGLSGSDITHGGGSLGAAIGTAVALPQTYGPLGVTARTAASGLGAAALAEGALFVSILSMSSDQGTPTQAELDRSAEYAAHSVVQERIREAENEYGPKQTVNLDTSGIIAATQLGNLTLNVATNLYLADKHLVTTRSAATELFYGNIKYTGPRERIAIVLFMARVTLIPNTPSARVMALKPSRAVQLNDQNIFGTGDQLGLQTITGDRRFVNAAGAQGVVFLPSPLVLPAPKFSGK
jgi:RHS repeat-associated protein